MSDFGLQIQTTDGTEIFRTSGSLQVWKIPRSKLSSIPDNLPGVYILISKSTVYVGEAGNLRSRILSHDQKPDARLRKFERIIILSDFRTGGLSDYSRANFRKSLESFVIQACKKNQKLKVINVIEQPPTLPHYELHLLKQYSAETHFVLWKTRVVPKPVKAGEVNKEEIRKEEIQKILRSKGYKVEKLTKNEAIINNVICLIRTGSDKPKGWQITLRLKEKFKPLVEGKSGYLLIDRGKGFLIPFSEIRPWLNTHKLLTRQTIDIFLKITRSDSILKYSSREVGGLVMEVEKYRLKEE